MTAAERTKLAAIEAGATADQTGTEIVAAIDGVLGTDWKAGAAASPTGSSTALALVVQLFVDDAANTIDLYTLFDGTFYYLADPTNRDAAYLEAHGSSMTVTAGGTEAISLSGGAPGATLIQGVLKTSRGHFSNVARESILLPAKLVANPTTDVTQSSATLSVGTNHFGAGSGTVYAFVRLGSSAQPSAATLKAGTGAVFAANVANPSASPVTFNATGLSSGQVYVADFLQNNGEDSAIATSAEFTFAAAGLGNPAAAFAGIKAIGVNSTTYTSASQSLQAGVPLLIVIAEQAASATDNPKTVTVGGVPAPQLGTTMRRSSQNMTVHYCASPPASGAIAVTAGAVNMSHVAIAGIHAAGMTSIAQQGTTQGTANPLSINITTSGAGRKVIYGAAAGAGGTVSVQNASATQLSTIDGGSTNNALCIAWEDAPAAAAYQGQLGTGSSASMIGVVLAVQ
jgi:hypothetical protein